MRSPSTLSEASVKPSFFLTTPAKKPRTECCCQPVAFMIAAMVAPFGSCSIARTADCFDDPALGSSAKASFGGAGLTDGAGFAGAATRPLAEGFAGDEVLRADFAGFDFGLVMAIGAFPLRQRQHALPLTQP